MPADARQTQGPGPEVLEAFGAHRVARRLAGGRGTAWRTDDVILKPRDMPAEALPWLADEVGPRLRPDLIRAALPLAARSGLFEVNGWTAFPALPGRHLPGRWLDIIAAGRAFSACCSELAEPAFIRARSDPWARADRAAWGEETVPGIEAIDVVRRIRSACRPVADPPTLVHGDLTGNVLFHPSLPPAVIDLSLYWRPAAFASAVVVVDAVTFERAPDALARTAASSAAASEGFAQCLLRAILFRLTTDYLTAGGSAPPAAASRYGRVIDQAFALLGEHG